MLSASRTVSYKSNFAGTCAKAFSYNFHNVLSIIGPRRSCMRDLYALNI